MTQPTFVPIAEADQVRPAMHMDVPGIWITDRPAELVGPTMRRGASIGTPGPDSGFALRLAHRFNDELKLGSGESAHDVTLGVALVAARRAALFGRAPCVYDVRLALNLWGFLDDVPADVQATRRALFSSIAHDYVAQRALVDSVPEETLRLQPEAVRAGGGPAA
ncbi:MAG TPA: hypothetical protein VH012_09350 [Acidimicrobiales bacterium]|jgi:hypothetical protein|nr:hypothetical protein [Acidimicrobiales bacterium]